MGIVFLAHDERLEHRVALKCLPVALAGDERRLAQFHNEVRLARQISHPNVCRVYDIGDANGQLFLTMEYIDGRDISGCSRVASASQSRKPWSSCEVCAQAWQPFTRAACSIGI